MGHALNSVLCDNALQHLFGARGPLDIVELPSHILQRAGDDAAVLADMRRRSDVLDGRVADAAAAAAAADAAVAQRELVGGVHALEALALPTLDLLLHGPDPPWDVAELRRRWHAALAALLPFELPPDAFPHLSINHVVTYGGLCYAYPYADALAGALWRRVLRCDAYNRIGGVALADCIFRPGGTLDAVAAINSLAPGAIVAAGRGFMPAVGAEGDDDSAAAPGQPR